MAREKNYKISIKDHIKLLEGRSNLHYKVVPEKADQNTKDWTIKDQRNLSVINRKFHSTTLLWSKPETLCQEWRWCKDSGRFSDLGHNSLLLSRIESNKGPKQSWPSQEPKGLRDGEAVIQGKQMGDAAQNSSSTSPWPEVHSTARSELRGFVGEIGVHLN